MTIEEWAKDFREYVDGLQLPNDDYKGVMEYIDDALELLKEQEAVKPVPPEDEFGLYRCGKCYYQLFRCVDKYCSRCGQAVKWE